MPGDGIVINNEYISEEVVISRRFLRRSAIIETLTSIDRGDYGFTIMGLRLMKTLEVVLSVFLETSKQLKNLITCQRGEGFARINNLSPEDIRFINIYSLYVSSIVAIDSCSLLTSIFYNFTKDDIDKKGRCKIKVDTVQVQGTFNLQEVNSFISLSTEELYKRVIKDYKDYLNFYKEHNVKAKRVNSIEKAIQTSVAYFKLIKNSLLEIVKDSSYKHYKDSIADIDVRVLNKVFKGFEYFDEAMDINDKGSDLMGVCIEDIIGNQNYLKAARRLALDVAGFDFSTWKNPKNVNPVLFALGNPGCGKTVTAHAIGNFFINFCEDNGIQARFVIIRRTDWASSYQNASSSRLIEIFKKNVLDFKGVVGFYWPDIDTAFAAREDSGIRNEEKNILGAVFGLFDGTVIPKNGQWFMLCDANYMNMDKATISRITQDPYIVKGPDKPEDFVKLLRDLKLRKHKEFLNITNEHWYDFGKKCVDYKLSGRSIENMSRKIIAMIEDFEYPKEYFKVDITRKREIIKKLSKILSYRDIVKVTDNYLKFERESEEKASRKRFEDRVREISTYLSAEKIARTTLAGID